MLIVAGYIRVPAEARAALEPHMTAYVAAANAEPGCQLFTFAFDVTDPERLRVFEIYDDEAAFAAHNAAPHVIEWRARRAAAGAVDYDISRYEVSAVGKF
ncbi:MAG TPA: antibiotic biosynthesis monooxygenase [Caulobacterales bacterium]|nr:antibiotic biosynthesis monooxygenase [Caulobacterales bacterium]